MFGRIDSLKRKICFKYLYLAVNYCINAHQCVLLMIFISPNTILCSCGVKGRGTALKENYSDKLYVSHDKQVFYSPLIYVKSVRYKICTFKDILPEIKKVFLYRISFLCNFYILINLKKIFCIQLSNSNVMTKEHQMRKLYKKQTFERGMRKSNLQERITRVRRTTNTTYAAFSKSVN